MNQAIKLGRFTSQQSTIFSSTPLASISGSRKLGARSVQVTSNSDPKQPPSTKIDMEKTFNSSEKPLNVMEESFGEGYATRSDEEGFGGTYGGNDECNAEAKINQDPAHHDSSQGSHVQEKEKGRNQTKAE